MWVSFADSNRGQEAGRRKRGEGTMSDDGRSDDGYELSVHTHFEMYT